MESKKHLSIRVTKTATEFEDFATKAMVEENWRPGLKDVFFFYFACDPTCGFVGEVNGKPVGCVTLTKYGDTFGFIGCYIVSKEYRGKGYGKAIFDAALSSVKLSRLLGLAALSHLEKMYQKTGFESVFYGTRFDLHLPTAVECLSDILLDSLLSIKCLEEVDWKTLLAYDSQVFGFPRHAFLSKWLCAQGSHTRVAVSNEGSVVGYVVVRPTFIKQDGFKIGPLFADSEPIAEMLLKTVFKSVFFQQGEQQQPVPVFCIDTFSEKGKQLALRLQGKIVFNLAYMTTKGVVPMACFDKWFGATAIEIG